MSQPKLTLQVQPNADLAIREQALYYRQHATRALAEKWRLAVNRTIHSLRSFPSRGTPFRAESSDLGDLRWLHVESFPSHLVVYRYIAAAATVLVVDVVHAARDLEEALGIAVRQ